MDVERARRELERRGYQVLDGLWHLARAIEAVASCYRLGLSALVYNPRSLPLTEKKAAEWVEEEARMLRRMDEGIETCSGCDDKPPVVLAPCPFEEMANANLYMCDCCDACRHGCLVEARERA